MPGVRHHGAMVVGGSVGDRSFADRGGVVDAERLATQLLQILMGSQLALMSTAVVAGWRTNPKVPSLAFLAIGIAYVVWLGITRRQLGSSAATPDRVIRRIDLLVIALAYALGAVYELVLQPVGTTAGIWNVGFPALVTAVFVASARLPPAASGIWTIVAGATHLLALRERSVPGIQGLAMLVALWVATSWVLTEVRLAGRAAEKASSLARRAEREEASARVHDALGLLQLARREGGAALPRLAAATDASTRRKTTWLENPLAPVTLKDEVSRMIEHFPDLRLNIDIYGLSGDVDSSVRIATVRAVHTLLTNVRLHASRATVTITGVDTPAGWTIRIADDGPGFDLDETTMHRGLTRFSTDALIEVGVTMIVQSTPGGGTQATLTGPALRSADCKRSDHYWMSRRFAAWRLHPAGGMARVMWIVDVSRGCLILTMGTMTAVAMPDIAHSPHAVAVVVVLVTAIVTLTGVWLINWETRRAPIVVVAIYGVCAASTMTVLSGADALTSNKLGPFLAAWVCMYLSTAGQRVVPLAVTLSLVAGGALSLVTGVVDGAFVAGWAVMGCLLAGSVVRRLTELGAAADAHRQRATEAERRQAARILDAQLTATWQLISPPSPNQRPPVNIESVFNAAETYLCPDNPENTLADQVGASLRPADAEGRLNVDLDNLSAVVPAELSDRVIRAMTEITALLLNTAGVKLSVRGAGDERDWRIYLLAIPPDGEQAVNTPDPAYAADLDSSNLCLRSAELTGGMVRLELRPRPDLLGEALRYTGTAG
jgi:hypothetical protein